MSPIVNSPKKWMESVPQVFVTKKPAKAEQSIKERLKNSPTRNKNFLKKLSSHCPLQRVPSKNIDSKKSIELTKSGEIKV